MSSKEDCTTCGGTGEVPYYDVPTGESWPVRCFGCGGTGKR